MINFCKTCLMPDTRPRIVFNTDGICNACLHSKKKTQINWNKRKEEFDKLIEEIKKNSKKNNSTYDCVVPWSGGKDSTSIALKLKFEYDLNPLLVTFSPLMINECGSFNRNEVSKMGFDSIFLNPNKFIARKLSKRFFTERGNPKVAWDAGVNAGPIRVALNFNIPTVFYAEHGESEYGGLVLNEESEKKRDIREVIEHQIGDFPENWVSEEIQLRDLSPYIYPSEEEIKENRLTAYYFSYFFKWSMLENYDYVKEKMPTFKTNPNGRTKGTFTNFDSLDDKIDCLYYYMQYIKFGFGRATRDSSRMIQNNQMTREKAIEFARKYDNEFPKDDFQEVLSYLNINNDQFEEIVNKHRNQEIWKSNINNKWELINSI
ncbi:N-acetyl sugar amidotransferase [Candidatus Pelagibacter bacterium]|nr:N-acetyl sugar amidotransferase [Candidatus Pelagibacter bacterium]